MIEHPLKERKEKEKNLFNDLEILEHLQRGNCLSFVSDSFFISCSSVTVTLSILPRREDGFAALLQNYFSRTNRAQGVEIATSELSQSLSAQCVRFVPARTFSLRILPGDDKLRTASIQARGADWWHVGKLGTKHAEERGRETRVSQTFDDVWRRLATFV